MPLDLRGAIEADVPLLARMNRHLIEDEGSRNSMSLLALQERMRDWLRQDWHIVLFVEGTEVAGYVVYRQRQDEYDPDTCEIYIRQFFVAREHRRAGLGRRVFRRLRETLFPADATIVLDVLASNPDGCRFWERMGFHPYCTTMKRPPG